MTVFALNLVLELFLGGMRLPYSAAVLTTLSQIEISVRELSLWFFYSGSLICRMIESFLR